MKVLRTTMLLLGLAALVVGAGSASAAPVGGATILVKFDRATAPVANAIVAGHGDAIKAKVTPRVVVVRVKPGESVTDAVAAYASMPNVVYAEQDVVEHAQTLPDPNDPSYTSQWSLATTGAVAGWSTYPGSYSTGGSSASQPPIAIVDSGIDSTHPDLAGRVDTADGANCLSGTCVASSALDDYGHGTHVAGIAAASANNLTGVAGVAFGAPVIPVKVLDSAGNGSAAGVAAGIDWAANHGARVINLSLGASEYSQTVCDAVSYATTMGVLVVAAAGNNGSVTQFYPAACPGAIGVGATDSTDVVPFWSDTGKFNVFVSAPGVNILSTYMGGGYQTESGTSMAAPFVSGLAELLFAQSTSRSADDVKRILATTSDKVGGASYGTDPNGVCASCTWNASYGYGRVDIYNALTGTIPSPSSSPDFTVGTATPSVTVGAGGTALYPLSIGSVAGFTGSVALSASGLPSGATASFSLASVWAPNSSKLTIVTSTTTPAGTYTITVQGTSGSLVHTVSLTLVVSGPDFAVVASPSSLGVTQGKSATSTISLLNLNGFKGTVSVSVSGAPTGATAKLSRTSLSGTTTATLTLAATTSTPAGTYTLAVKGVSGSLTRTTNITLAVSPIVPDFKISASPTSISTRHGSAVNDVYKITVTPLNGFKGTVSLAAAGLPSNMTSKWSVASVSITSTSAVTATYTVSIPASAVAGKWTITVTATSGSLTHTLPLTLTLS